MKKFEDRDTAKRGAIRKSRSAQKRTLIKEKGKIPETAVLGLVTAYIGKFIIVKSIKNKKSYECYLGGTLISPNGKSSLISVGDTVKFIIDEYQNESTETGLETAVIIAVDERKNLFARHDKNVPWHPGCTMPDKVKFQTY